MKGALTPNYQLVKPNAWLNSRIRLTDLVRVPSLWLAGELTVFQIDHPSCRFYPSDARWSGGLNP